jgi:hypothetical protein
VNAPYQILVWLSLIWSPLAIAEVAWPSELARHLGVEGIGGCAVGESWGVSIYLADGENGISHYLKHQDRYQAVRFIATDKGVIHCSVVGDALVFVDPAHGVYQTDRSIESDGEQLWLSALPIHYRQQSRFESIGEELFLVTDRLRDPILIDVSVRNDQVPELMASEQITLPSKPQRMSPPIAVSPNRMLVVGDDKGYSLDVESALLKPMEGLSAEGSPDTKVRMDVYGSYSVMRESADRRVVAALLPDALWVQLVTPKLQPVELGLSRDADAQGLCLGEENLVSFDRDGQLRRYELQQNGVELVGTFELSREALSCLVDVRLKRLYVVEREVGIWVFDLAKSGLEMPRAVTTDKMVESLGGLALYEEGEQGYILSQSLGDGTFLVFDRGTMRLAGIFRIAANLPAGVDGVRASRGFAATAKRSAKYPSGMLVVHDQRHRMPEAGENLKLVDWRSVEQLLSEWRGGK